MVRTAKSRELEILIRDRLDSAPIFIESPEYRRDSNAHAAARNPTRFGGRSKPTEATQTEHQPVNRVLIAIARARDSCDERVRTEEHQRAQDQGRL